MKILVTGASSYLGADLYVRLKDKYSVIGTYHSNKLFPELQFLDITNRKSVVDFIVLQKPDVIIHVAANASGKWCEKNQEEAIAVNQNGTSHIVDAANMIGAKIIFISSFAVANIDTLYGRTKIESEQYLKATKAGYIILRPSLIIGLSPNTVNDRPFNRILKNITEWTRAIYDTSWLFQPTWLRHIWEVVEGVLDQGIVNEIIPISIPDLKTRYDLAKNILAEFDIEVIPEDLRDTSPVASEKWDKLRELGLPQYTYEEMIVGIVQEIKNKIA